MTKLTMRIALLSVLCLISSASLEAALVTHWMEAGETKKVELFNTQGTVVSWDIKTIVINNLATGKPITIKRDEIVAVALSDQELGDDVVEARRTKNAKALLTIAADANRPAHVREEAGYLAAFFGNSVRSWKKFLEDFPSGNYAMKASQRVAELSLKARDSAGAKAALNTAAKLGTNVTTARANQRLGEIFFAENNVSQAKTHFSAAAAAAEKTHFTIDKIKANAWSGRCAEASDDKSDAKTLYEKAADADQGVDSSDSPGLYYAKGYALMGLGRLAGDTKEAYFKFLAASYWISGDFELESNCLINMLRIAEIKAENGSGEEKEWGKKSASKLREKLQEVASEKLKEYEKNK